MPRPQSIASHTIVAAAYTLLMEEGPSNLTFERLGAKVGLVPAALVRRFKTKRQLLLEVDRYALALTDAKVAEAIEKTASPIEAIIAQFTTEMAFASSIENFANGQEFLLMDFRDTQLYPNYRASFQHRHAQIVELLSKAQAAGTLKSTADANELARHLEMLLHGAGHVWAMTQEGPIEDYISRHVHVALRPYLEGNISDADRSYS